MATAVRGAADAPSLAGTPLDHDEDALSHLMGVMGMRLLMIGAAVSKPWRGATRRARPSGGLCASGAPMTPAPGR